MARVRCPRCYQTANFTGNGKWYVHCEKCGTKFVTYIATKEGRQRVLTCPTCGYQETTTVNGNIRVKCSKCLNEFISS